MNHVISKIRDTLGRLRHAAIIEAPPPRDTAALPPFYIFNAAMAARVKTWRAVYVATVVVLGGVIVLQQRIIFHKLFEKMNAEIVIVPGSPEFFRVRPGQIPDQSVFLFAEYVAANLGTFSYRNVKYQFAKIAEHMSPAARGRFEALFEPRLKDWSDRKMDQSFAYEPVRHFELTSDERGPKYIAAVEGTRTQYVEGRAFSETRDVLLLVFRPRGNLTPDRPYIFDVDSVEWLTAEQFQTLKAAKGLGKSQGATL